MSEPPTIKAARPQLPIHVSVVDAGFGWWRVWTGVGGRLDNPLSPPLPERAKAVRIACKVTAALRDEEVPVATVVTISDATALRDYIDEEVENEIDMLGDMKHSELMEEALNPSGWTATLGSIKLNKEDGSMTLDYDQAVCVQELLPQVLEAVEDYDDPDDPVPTTLAMLRGYARQLEAAGFPFERSFGPDGKYIIKLADENQGDPYVVWVDGGESATVQTLAEGWKLTQEWAGPPVGSQLKLPDDQQEAPMDTK